MKFKLLKKMMMVCMSFSLAISALPASAFAAGTAAPGEQTTDTEAKPSANSTIDVLLGIETEQETGHTEAASEVQPQSEVITPQSEAVSGSTAERQTREIATDIFKGQLKDGSEYTLANGIYSLIQKKNGDTVEPVTYTVNLEGVSANEIEVPEGVTLILMVNGIGTSTIEKISGNGKVVLDSSSNGKLKLGEAAETLASFKVQGGTVFGKTDSSQIKCPEIIFEGGSIACNVANTSVIKDANGTVLQQYTIGTVEKNAVCTISDFKRNGEEDASAYNNHGIWSDAAGKVTLIASEDIKNYNFTITARTFEISDDKSTLTAEEQKYTYKQAKVSKYDSKETAYKIVIGAELKTVYGKKADAASVITFENGKSSDFKSIQGTLEENESYAEAKLTLSEKTVTQVNAKEKPSENVYSYTAEMTVEDKMGYSFELSGLVTLLVEKAEITPVLSAKETDDTTVTSIITVSKVYDGTTDVPSDVIFDLTFKGTVDGDVVTGQAGSYAYNDPNSTAYLTSLETAKNTKVVASDITLDNKQPGDNWSNYYKLSKENAAMNGKIEKAPCAKAPTLKEAVLGKSDISMTSSKIVIQGVAGQEYSYKAKSGSKTSWTKCPTGQAMTISNTDDEEKVTANTEYTIYARVAERDNYEASEEVSVTVTTPRAPYTYKKADVSIGGITDNGTYTVGTELKLTATGKKPDVTKKELIEGDEKFVPYSWKLVKNHVWKKSPYTAKITPEKEGKYTVVVTFHKYVYDGSTWVRKEKGDVTKSVTFKATKSTTSSTSSGSTSSRTSSTTTKTSTAARTSDTTPLILLIVAFVASGIALVVTNKKKKTKK